MVEVALLPPVKPEPPAPTAASPAATAATTGGFGVQLAASPEEADAQRLLSKISREQEELLGAYPLQIIRAEIEGKGTFYRVRTQPFGDRSQAGALCSALKGAGQDCFVFPLGR
jgi:cell division septation protein DedD